MHYFKKVYSDGFLTDTQRLHNNARTLRNPDGKPGISTHFDAGIEPPTNNDITLYGNWGGYDSVDAVSFTNNNGETKWRGASPANAYKHNIVTSRLGIFRYLLFYTTGGASQGPGWLLAFNGHDGYISAHETGHSLWLGHSAPIHLPIAADVNCKPNYASIMNYAFTDTGFSDGVGVPSLNNARLVESNSIDPANTQFLDVLENNFLYWIDRKTGSVDWNRDGFFAPNYQTVRAYANFQPGGDCEFTRYNQRSLPDAKSASTPSLVRISGTLYAFHTDLNGNVNYSVSTSDWNCPKPAPHCNGSSWGPPHSTDMKGEQGSDVEKVTIRGIEKALVISIDANGKLWQRLMQKNYFGNEKFYDEKEIPQTLEAVGLPSVAVTEGINPKIFLTFRGIDGYYHFNTASFEGDGTLKWDTDKYVFKSLGIPISADTFSSPAIKYTYFPTVSGKVLVGLFPTTTGHMEILRHNQSNSYWERFKNLTTEYHEHISGRPSLAFVPFDDTNTENGRIYIAYTAAKYDQTKQVPGEMRMLWSYREPVQSGTRFFLVDKIGLDSSFDNVWGLSFGMDLLYEHGIDYNLRALHTNGINKPGMYNALVFRPKADGINDFEYGNPNDWETLRIGLCKEITDPSGLITKQGLTPIKCPTWPSSN
ncbi:MAG: hypothetical protein A3K03_08690 [Bdellovibrionales bacterium RIFOXYD1_FULL_44_7]|nr:MAG: hypothetical protein A3K03_08690 [Bdellovibrionales bacterium RIFOXYD1_FULL_44_7]